MAKSILNQRTTPFLPNAFRRRHKQTSNTKSNLLYYPFASNETNKTTVKASTLVMAVLSSTLNLELVEKTKVLLLNLTKLLLATRCDLRSYSSKDY